MHVGFVSAILADQSLEEVAGFAAAAGFQSVELMCWPPGKAERRYAGVTHLDVTAADSSELDRVRNLLKLHNHRIAATGA